MSVTLKICHKSEETISLYFYYVSSFKISLLLPLVQLNCPYKQLRRFIVPKSDYNEGTWCVEGQSGMTLRGQLNCHNYEVNLQAV